MAASHPVRSDDLENTGAALGAAVLQGVAAVPAAPFLNAAALLSSSQQKQQPLQQQQSLQQQAVGQQQQEQSHTNIETDARRRGGQLQQQVKHQDGDERLPDATAAAAALSAVSSTSTAAGVEASAASGLQTAASSPGVVPPKPGQVVERQSTSAEAGAATAAAGAATATDATAVKEEGLVEVKGDERGAKTEKDQTFISGEPGAAGGEESAAAAARRSEGEEEREDDAYVDSESKDEDERGPSRLKFPTYEEFLKEEEEEQRAAAADDTADGEERAGEDDGQATAELDAAFDLFMNEVKDMPSTSSRRTHKGGTTAAKERQMTSLPLFKTPDEECVRLTAQVFPSPFQVLLLGPDSTEDDIRRQYRKLSLLIHPDKCKHPNAHEAFQVVNKAYEQLQQPEMREKYREVIEEAKRRVIKERVKENRRRKAQGAGVALLSEEVADLQQEITDMCEKLLQETKERREYAERTRQANERYEKEQAEKLEKEELDKCRERKAFLDRRDERVEGWRQYQEAVRSKEVKLQAFTGVKHQREQRKEEDIVRKRQKIQGIDSSYKSSWR